MSNHIRRASLSLVDRPDYFRLLKILPGRNSEKIKCSLSVHEISSVTGTYISGSYVWGPKTDLQEILVDDEPVNIRQRLWTFLRHLRQPDRTVEVWIDALCIKQNDPKEKSQQIRLLSRIFRCAGKSISWLGEADADIHRAFDIVEQRATETRELYGRRMSFSHLLSGDEWRCVIKLLNHEYFSRRWIVQEVMLPVTLTLQCGNRSLPLTSLESFLSSLSHWESRERCLQVDQSIIRRLWTDRAKIHVHSGGFQLPDLLLRYKDTECSKPCDRINAFLGMLPQGHTLYCEDDLQTLYDRVIASSDRKELDLMAFELFLQQELGLSANASQQKLIMEDKPLSTCKAF